MNKLRPDPNCSGSSCELCCAINATIIEAREERATRIFTVLVTIFYVAALALVT